MAVLVPSAPVTHLEFTMNIELEEVVRQDVSDDALEQAASGAQWGNTTQGGNTLFWGECRARSEWAGWMAGW